MSNKWKIIFNMLIISVFMFSSVPVNVVEAFEDPFAGIKFYESEHDGSTQPYGVFIPEPSDKESPRPILFLGHGAGGRASVPSATSEPQKWIVDNNKNWIVVKLDYRGPQANNQGQFDPFEVIRDLETVEGYTLDHDRFYLQGGSLGGSDTYRLGFRYPDMWAAIAPQTGWTDYREFWPHWYEHWDKSTVLRRSMFEGFQSTNLNTRNDVVNMTYYVDPVLVPMLETNSPLWQASNGLHLPAFIMSCYDDPTNLRVNQEQVRDVYEANGYDYTFKQVATGGHGCAVLDWSELMPWLDSKVRVTNPLTATYTTNSLQYNKAYWIQLDQFIVEKNWSKLTAEIDETTQQSIVVSTENLSAFTLFLNDELIADMSAEITVMIDGNFSMQVMPTNEIAFKAVFSEDNQITDWVLDGGMAPTSGSSLLMEADGNQTFAQFIQSKPEAITSELLSISKKSGVSGPFSDAFYNPFTVVYATQGSEQENAASLRAAQEFAMEWNNWLILHIGNYGSYRTSIPVENVWEGISTFPYYGTLDGTTANPPGGPTTEQANTLIVRPVADVDLTIGDIKNTNLIIFGEPSTNLYLNHIEGSLPFTFDSGSITIEGRTYSDGEGNNPKDAALVDYSYVYPNPMNPDKYIAVSRYGLWMDWKNPSTAWLKFTSTGIEYQSFDFQFPDYFIGWRLNDLLMDGVHGMYFQDTWFESGYFNSNWKLDTTAPISSYEILGEIDEDGWYAGDVAIELTATDNPGGFGVDQIEYSLDGGNSWLIYEGSPITFTKGGVYDFQFRSKDLSGKYQYGMIDPWAQFGKTFQDGEQWLSFASWNNVEEANHLEIKVDIKDNFIFLPIILQ